MTRAFDKRMVSMNVTGIALHSVVGGLLYAGAFLPGEHDVFPQQVLKLGSSFILGRLFSSSAHSIHQLLAFHSGYRPDEADEN